MTIYQGARVCVVWAVCGLVGLALTVNAKVQVPFPALTEKEGVNILRSLVNAEIALEGRGSLRDVLLRPEATGFARDVTGLDGWSASLRGYRLRLNSHDGEFQISLLPDKGCGLAFWGTDSSVIHVGRALGCDMK